MVKPLGGDASDRFDPDGTLYRSAFAVVVSLLIALVVGYVVYRFAPLRDPIGVVGPPLVTGYCERNEQFGFYAFCLTVLVAGVVSCTVARRFRPEVVKPLGALAILALTVLVAVLVFAVLPIAASYLFVILAGGVVFCFGFTSAAPFTSRMRVACMVVTLILAAWTIPFRLEAFSELYSNLLDDNYFVGILIFAVLAVLIRFVLIRWSPACDERIGRPWLYLVMVLVVSGILLVRPVGEVLSFGVFGILSYVLGHLASGSNRFGSRVDRVQLPVIVIVVALILIMPTYSIWLANRWVGVLTIGVGAWVGTILCRSDLPRVLPPGVPLLEAHSLKSFVLGVCLCSLVLLLPSKPWFAGVLLTCAAILSFKTRTLRPRFAVMLLLAGAIFAAVCQFDEHLFERPNRRIGMYSRQAESDTGALSSYVDKYHDGQILSAVWEFENGRRLNSEVCPLRTFEFFTTWISRKVLPHTHESFVFTLHFLGPLTYVGVCVVIFAWTRSLAWSFSAAVIAMCVLQENGRFGMHLCLAGLTLELLRKRSPWCWVGLGVVGCLAGLNGYDCFASVVAAAVVALFVSPIGCPVDKTTRVRFSVRCLQAFGAGFGISAMLTLLLTIWQGADSAAAFWYLFFEYVRNVNSIYGLPIDWNENYREWLMLYFLTLSAWAVGGAWAWKSMRAERRRIWCFLFVFVIVFLQRGFGRSDMYFSLFAIYVLIALGVFEVLSHVRRVGCRFSLLDRKVMAISLAAFAAWQTPKGSGSPLDLFQQFQQLSSHETRDLGQDDFVLRNVPKDQSLWGIDDGLTNFAHHRHNPTRYPLAYVIPSPAEQIAVVAALRRQPPALIVWPTDRMLIQEIPFSLRYYVISQHVFRNYKPSSQPGYLEPAEEGWLGLNTLNADFNFPLELGRLPLTWGSDRRPQMLASVIDKQELDLRRIQGSALREPGVTSEINSEYFETMATINSRHGNYLVIQLAVENSSDESDATTTMTLEFAPSNAEYDTVGRVTFDVLADGRTHTYLIPVGCSPAWSWRSQIERVRLYSDSLQQLSIPTFECWHFDEFGATAPNQR